MSGKSLQEEFGMSGEQQTATTETNSQSQETQATVNTENNTEVQPPENSTPSTQPTHSPKDYLGDDYAEKDWAAVKNEIAESKKKYFELEERTKEIANQRPKYANEEVAEFDNFIKNGGVADYNVFKSLKSATNEMDSIDALILKQVLENPSYKGHEAILKDKLIEKYGVDENLGLPDEQISFNRLELQKDADNAKKFIAEQKDKLKIQEDAPINTEEIIANRSKEWEQAISPLQKDLAELSIFVASKKGDKYVDEEYMKFKVPEHILNQIQQTTLQQIAKTTNVSSETLNSVRDHIKGNAFLQCFPFILKEALDKKETELADFYDKKYSGDPKLGTIGKPAINLSESDKEIENKILNL